MMSVCCSASSSSSGNSIADPSPTTIIGADNYNWGKAEDTARDIVCEIQPTLEADLKRRDVIDYVQRLIRTSLGYEVFPYGSVPLKTYLPDGDIDLTALSISKADDALASDVQAVLEREQHNDDAEFEVNDVQFIDAEVKLVKCLVQNTVVDISFNQLGGLCTLCFLEQVDRFIGKDHLFKRSIILIKAWCYYESRILGAHHGLISTYALETLVLYIFHMFHSDLNGPLAVLYRFLDYFGAFDWDNYCVSLRGPVSKSSLPDIVAEISENGGCDVLLSDEFLKNCVDMFTVPSRGLEANSRIFPQKHLNIIDPLKGNNNLGRSVHRGNYYRIRSAFKHGARKLGWILQLPRERIADELQKFFTNTLERHGSKYCDDIQIPILNFSGERSGTLSSSSFTTISSEGNLNSLSGFSEENFIGTDDENAFKFEKKPDSSATDSLQSGCEVACPANGDVIQGYSVKGNGDNQRTSNFQDPGVANITGCSISDSGTSLLSVEKSHAENNLSFPALVAENFTTEYGNHCRKGLANPSVKDAGYDSHMDSKENQLMNCNSLCLCSINMAGVAGSTEEPNSLLDLSGDYDSHIRSLLYGQCCHGYDLSATTLSTSPVSPSRVRRKNSWETVRHSLHFKWNFESQQNINGTILRPPLYPLNHPAVSDAAAFSSELKQKLRGTGTFFPKMNCHTNKDKPVPGRKRNQVAGPPGQFQVHTYKKGLSKALQETNLSEECSHELSQAQFPVLCHSKSGSADVHHTYPPINVSSHTNDYTRSFDQLEFGSIKRWLLEVSLPEGSNHEAFGTPCAQGSAPNAVESAVWSPRAVSDDDSLRFAGQQFRLRDEGDFPPLSL